MEAILNHFQSHDILLNRFGIAVTVTKVCDTPLNTLLVTVLPSYLGNLVVNSKGQLYQADIGYLLEFSEVRTKATGTF